MAWLTVREVAEALEVSESAVRKRMRRGTLPHRKESNGRVYAYVPEQKAAEGDARVPQPEDSEQGQSHSWLEYVAAGTGAIALLGGLTYGLGLLALWIPIWRAYTHSASSAWYAVSLVPKTVVAGLGLAQLVAIPTVYVVGSVAAFLFVAQGRYYVEKRWGKKGPWAFVELLMLGTLVLLAWTIGTIFEDLSLQVLVAIVVAPLLIGNAILLSTFLRDKRRRDRVARMEADRANATEASDKEEVANTARDIPPTGDDSNDIARPWVRRLFRPAGIWPPLIVLIWFIVSAYIGAIINICACPPPLSNVEMSGKKDMKGALLAHTDGFWYVFDVAGKNKGELIALRDDQVETVTLSSEGKSSDGKSSDGK
jgi:hypothetical protein